MKNIFFILTITALTSLFISTPSTAQEQKKHSISPESKITVDGTSNRDNWTVIAPEYEGFVSVVQSNGDIPIIQDARITIQVAPMTGGRGSVMDRLMLNALKANEHPEITFALKEAKYESGSEGSGKFMVSTLGELSVAGVTNTIEMILTGERQNDGIYRFQGSHTLLMRDYDITPPTAMFGSLVTGNEVVIHLDILTASQ